MKRIIHLVGAFWPFAFAMATPWQHAQANPAQSAPTNEAARLCRDAARIAEREHGVPPFLLAAIARVESGRRDLEAGRVTSWPWTVNAEGDGRYFASRSEAIAAVRQLQARGVRSIDVGCMQINLLHHPTAFASLEEAFEPVTNARYAGRYLRELHETRRDWHAAAGAYHSRTPSLSAQYRERVAAAWPEEILEAAQADLSNSRRSTTRPDQSLPPLPPAVQNTAMPSSMPARAAATQSPAAGTLSLSNRAERAQIMYSNTGGGRGLDAYRQSPITMTSRIIPPRR